MTRITIKLHTFFAALCESELESAACAKRKIGFTRLRTVSFTKPMNKPFQAWLERIKLLGILVLFTGIALTIMIVLETLIDRGSIAPAGRVLYAVGGIVLFIVYWKRRQPQRTISTEASEEDSSDATLGTQPHQDPESLDEIRSRIRARKGSGSPIE